MQTKFDPLKLVRPRRRIVGMSAILLPFDTAGEVDWTAFVRHVARTIEADLIPAVNMDTGYVNLLDDVTRERVLDVTQKVASGRMFVAGAFVGDRPGDPFNVDGYRRAMEAVQARGGTPVVFQSYGLTSLLGPEVVAAYQSLSRDCSKFIAFELGTQFAPFGRIYDIETYRGLLGVQACIGAKHSSLSRTLEWDRLVLRDSVRPEFMVLTGNDLGIDMVMYGSDYLLGLSTFAPAEFARRDRFWEQGDSRFYELNDVLQYLGFFAFRPPVPAYKHSAAQFLQLRGWNATDRTHPLSASRPESDRQILADILNRLAAMAE